MSDINAKVVDTATRPSMARLNFCIFCEYSVISKEGTPSFVGVFSQIIGKNLPFVRSEMSVVVNYFPEDTKKHELKIIVKSPTGEIIHSTDSASPGPASSKENDLGFIFKIQNLKFEGGGIYNFEIFADGEKIGVAPLEVKLEK